MLALVISALAAAAIAGVVIARITARDARHTAGAMVARDAPPPLPPVMVRALDLGECLRWAKVTDDGTILSLHAATLVMVKRDGTVTLRVPLAEMSAISAPRSLPPEPALPAARNLRFSGGDLTKSLFDPNHARGALSDELELHITWQRPFAEPRVLKWQIEDARSWADDITAAVRRARDRATAAA